MYTDADTAIMRAYYKNERGPAVTLYVPTTTLYVWDGSKGASSGGLSAGAIAGIAVGAAAAACIAVGAAWLALRRRRRRKATAAAAAVTDSGGSKGGTGAELPSLVQYGSGTSSDAKALSASPADVLLALPDGYSPGATGSAAGTSPPATTHSSAASGQLPGLPELAELVQQHDAAAASSDLGRLQHEPRTPPVTHVLLGLDGLPPELREWTVPPAAIAYMTHPGGQLQVIGQGGSARVVKATYNGELFVPNKRARLALRMRPSAAEVGSEDAAVGHGCRPGPACTCLRRVARRHLPASRPHPPLHLRAPRRRGGGQGVRGPPPHQLSTPRLPSSKQAAWWRPRST